MSAGSATLNGANANIDDWRPAVYPWIIAITVTLATFMEVLDTSIANVALPPISGSLYARQARHGLRRLRHRCSHCPCHRPDSRWMDHQQLHLALDFLHQHPGRNHLSVAPPALDSRPAIFPSP